MNHEHIKIDLAAKYGMTVRGLQAWGNAEGYWFEVELPPNSAQTLKIRTAALFPNEAAAHHADTAFTAAMRGNSAIRYQRNDEKIMLTRKMLGSFRKLQAQDVGDMLGKTAMILRGAKAASTCFRCGANNADAFVMVDGVALKYCNKCLAEAENAHEQRQGANKATGKNYLRGITGAFIGALLGSLVWISLGLVSRVAVIGGIAVSFCTIKGYKILKGKITKAAVFITCMISFIFFSIAEFFRYDIAAISNEIAKRNAGMDFWAATHAVLTAIFTNGKVAKEFLINCPWGFLFLVAGAFIALAPHFSKAKDSTGQIERL
jgi:hypothetical protein